MHAVHDDWLEDVIVVNETRERHVAGSVSIFRSAGDACRHLESWWVEQNEGFALDGRGRQITFGIRNKAVVVERCDPVGGGVELLLTWLQTTASHMQSARTSRAKEGKLVLGLREAQGVLPGSIEGLIAYIGFAM
jgi:hypothetical protein